MNYTDKQEEALDYLSPRSNIEQLLYGGSAGSGKTLLGCDWQIKRRLKYPGTRGLIGRAVLKKLRLSTMKTFWKLMAGYGMKPDIHYKYHGQDQIITFWNGSEIMLMDLADSPSDPEFQNLGSIEITDYFVDESGEISMRCLDILDSRTRYMLTEFCNHCSSPGLDSGMISIYDEDGKAEEWLCKSCGGSSPGLKPKGLMTCNPNKGWLYHEFYDAQRKGMIRPDRYFLQALPSDNPHLPKAYLEKLAKLPEIDKRRLLYGDWDYDESKDRLYDYDDLLRCFRDISEQEEKQGGEMYITCDVARAGRDRTIIILWKGLVMMDIKILQVNTINQVVNEIREWISRYNIRLHNVLVDEDGVGGGCKDYLSCKGFINGSKAIRDNYINLKADCYFKLAELITENKILLLNSDSSLKNDIIKELEMIRRTNIGNEKKLSVTSKKNLTFSPDIADAIMMRAFYELKKNYGVYSYA
ncbi:hypothetical protein UFOVP386_6 [uncultured Caudovirales phage]|uniref:Phage terminase large subunit n=1 Tax=uncultured Caudovirales phage TaxID=2100421 RepID=A0A6J7X084_9CAUD|nr:hypothetical protein UFOVP386_6 [uncultured Caudovirales phage]